MLLLFVAGVFLVRRNMVTPPIAPASGPEVAVRNEGPVHPVPGPVEVKDDTPVQPAGVASIDGPRRNRGERSAKPKRSLAAVDLASEAPLVISQSQRQSAIFPIDASLQSLRVSIDDGYGNARTISVPMISFGSQRVLATGNQFAPKGVW
jgi:hypothetical protein